MSLQHFLLCTCAQNSGCRTQKYTNNITNLIFLKEYMHFCVCHFYTIFYTLFYCFFSLSKSNALGSLLDGLFICLFLSSQVRAILKRIFRKNSFVTEHVTKVTAKKQKLACAVLSKHIVFRTHQSHLCQTRDL